MVGELLDRGVEQLGHDHHEQRADQRQPPGEARCDEEARRQADRQRGELLADRLLVAQRPAEAVERVEEGFPETDHWPTTVATGGVNPTPPASKHAPAALTPAPS